MNRLILITSLALLILPLPAAAGSSSVVEKLMQDCTTTNTKKESSGKKSYLKDPLLCPALQDMGKEIDGRLEANQMLHDKLAARDSQGEDARTKNKRQAKAKRQRWKKEHQERQPKQ